MWKKFRNTNYEVNEYGIIRHINTKYVRKPYQGEYLRISLYENKQQFTIHVHEIVAELYLPIVKGCNCINHKDGNKYNNYKDNLERTTQSENLKHAYKTGLKNAKGDKNGRAIGKKKILS